MTTIQAVVIDPAAPGHLTLGQVDAPAPARNEVVVRVRAISLNRGEVRRAQMQAAGERTGWDIAGDIEQGALDGSGPKAGQRVVGLLRTNAWAEFLAVPVDNLAVLPENVTYEQAATLPVAGLTALYALDRSNGLAGRNVAITGASGGVGHFAVQMASRAGATVTGLVRQERHAGVVSEAGADHVVVDDTGASASAFAPFDLVLDSVGGAVLSNLMGMMAPRGNVVVFGTSAGTTLSFEAPLFNRTQSTLSGLLIFDEMQRETARVGLTRLLSLVSRGHLTPLITLQDDWSQIGQVAQHLIDRTFAGKAVLRVS